jgi:hypothetical protein
MKVNPEHTCVINENCESMLVNSGHLLEKVKLQIVLQDISPIIKRVIETKEITDIMIKTVVQMIV